MEPDTHHVFIGVQWRSNEQISTYLNQLLIIINHDDLLKYVTGNYWENSIEYGAILFLDLANYDFPLSNWINAIDHIVTFLNDNNINWRANKIPFIQGIGPEEDDEVYGYIILNKNYLIITYVDNDGNADPTVYQLGKSSKLD